MQGSDRAGVYCAPLQWPKVKDEVVTSRQDKVVLLLLVLTPWLGRRAVVDARPLALSPCSSSRRGAIAVCVCARSHGFRITVSSRFSKSSTLYLGASLDMTSAIWMISH